jgi:hypothetical protein
MMGIQIPLVPESTPNPQAFFSLRFSLAKLCWFEIDYKSQCFKMKFKIQNQS